MRKSLLVMSLGVLAAASFGCALTDYGTFPGGMGVHNKSHGVIGCTTDDRFANTQQSLEAETRAMLYTSTYGTGPGNPACAIFGFYPTPTANTVSQQDAKDWNRFIADWVFAAEAQVFSPASIAGTYITAGAKDLADGSVRLNNYAAYTFAFSCVGAAVNGRYGGPEGVVVGDKFTRLPDLYLDTIAIDNNNNPDFCENIAAISVTGANRWGATGYSLWAGLLGRTAEGRIPMTPVTRHEGLAEFLSGQPMTANVLGTDITISGNLQADGRIEVSVLGMASNGVTYTAEEPIRLTVDPSNGYRTWEVRAGNHGELGRLAAFALQADLTDRTFDLSNVQVPELGLTMRPFVLRISGEFCRALVNGSLHGGTDGGAGIGG